MYVKSIIMKWIIAKNLTRFSIKKITNFLFFITLQRHKKLREILKFSTSISRKKNFTNFFSSSFDFAIFFFITFSLPPRLFGLVCSSYTWLSIWRNFCFSVFTSLFSSIFFKISWNCLLGFPILSFFRRGGIIGFNSFKECSL